MHTVSLYMSDLEIVSGAVSLLPLWDRQGDRQGLICTSRYATFIHCCAFCLVQESEVYVNFIVHFVLQIRKDDIPLDPVPVTYIH